MKKTKKILTFVSLACVLVSVAMLIGAIFKLPIFKKPLLNILLSLATIGVATAFSVNSISIYKKNRSISIATIALMTATTVMALIIYFTNFTTPVYFNKVIIVLGMFAVLFNIIISLILKLDKKYLVLQIITYLIILAIDIILTLQVFRVNVFGIKGFWKFFLVLCLVAFGLLCTTSIIGRKTVTDEKDEINTKPKTANISNEEYFALLQKVEKLKAENAELKRRLGL